MTDPDTLTTLEDGWVRGELRTIGDGRSIDDARRPDLPHGTPYRLVEDRGITMLVEWQPVD